MKHTASVGLACLGAEVRRIARVCQSATIPSSTSLPPSRRTVCRQGFGKCAQSPPKNRCRAGEATRRLRGGKPCRPSLMCLCTMVAGAPSLRATHQQHAGVSFLTRFRCCMRMCAHPAACRHLSSSMMHVCPAGSDPNPPSPPRVSLRGACPVPPFTSADRRTVCVHNAPKDLSPTVVLLRACHVCPTSIAL